jgi:hypothetical protein
VFRLGPFGYLSPSPVVNAEPGTVPFAVNFDAVGHIVTADAGTNALSSYSLASNGTLIDSHRGNRPDCDMLGGYGSGSLLRLERWKCQRQQIRRATIGKAGTARYDRNGSGHG